MNPFSPSIDAVPPHVAEGPATRDLPALPTTIDDHGHLIILALAGPDAAG